MGLKKPGSAQAADMFGLSSPMVWFIYTITYCSQIGARNNPDEGLSGRRDYLFACLLPRI